VIRKIIFVLIVAVGLAAIGTLFINRFRYHRQQIKSCFNDVQGLREGAPVRLAGVNIGTVRHVRANPQRKDCPAEVEMTLATTYEIRIPKDSIAGIETAGVLGESFVSIDAIQASGPPIENYGYLKSRPSNPPATFEDYLKALDLVLGIAKFAKEMDKGTPKATAPSSSHQPRR
jgi:phospholipid/cholesterol/gamma-HCH transport system substrate-binding protein